MRGLTWVGLAVVVAAGCTPRDNRDSDLELERSDPERVYAEPTVTGGAYDSLTSRVAPADSVSHGGGAAPH